MEFVTRAACPLCEHALPVVERAAGRLRIDVRTVDLESDDDLIRQFALRIPVVRGPDGTVLAEGIIEYRPLVAALVKARFTRSSRD